MDKQLSLKFVLKLPLHNRKSFLADKEEPLIAGVSSWIART
jgi:hypothetical protein